MTLSPTSTGSLTLESLGDGVRRLTLTRPERMNTLNRQVFADLRDALDAVERDSTRALVITGAGERSFCAGYDLAEIDELRELTVPQFVALEQQASQTFAAVHRLPFPVVAAVNGAAYGGGLSLALAADLRLAVPASRFSVAFARVGLSVGELGTSWLLSRVVGPGVAAELAFTGRLVAADEAYRLGLVTRVVQPDALEAEAVELARRLADERSSLIGKRTLLSRLEVASFRAALDADLGDRL